MENNPQDQQATNSATGDQTKNVTGNTEANKTQGTAEQKTTVENTDKTGAKKEHEDKGHEHATQQPNADQPKPTGTPATPGASETK